MSSKRNNKEKEDNMIDNKKTMIIGVVGAALLVCLSIIAINKENLKDNIFNTPNEKSMASSESTNKTTTESEEDNRRVVKVKVNSKESVKNTIIKTIKKELNEDFDINDYKYEVSNGPDGKIYDFNYMIKDVITLYGYTAMVEGNTIEIYDNMGDFLSKLNKDIPYDESLNDQKKINSKIEELLEKYKKQYQDYTITFDSTIKKYDEDNDIIILVIYFKMSSNTTGATSIISESFTSLN